jgi:hypothetical protein
VTAQYTDPVVSRTKFDREIAEFRALEPEYRKRGWFLVRAEFPEVLVVLAAGHVKPAPIVTGVKLTYENYDAEPPSVRLVDPFTSEPYRAKELPTQLMRVGGPPGAFPQIVGLPANTPMPMMIQQVQPLMQAHTPDEVPFLCIAGVREYHEHPAHTGDSWELHRATGAGRLVRLLEVIHRYGIAPITGYAVNLVPQVSIDPGQPQP